MISETFFLQNLKKDSGQIAKFTNMHTHSTYGYALVIIFTNLLGYTWL